MYIFWQKSISERAAINSPDHLIRRGEVGSSYTCLGMIVLILVNGSLSRLLGSSQIPPHDVASVATPWGLVSLREISGVTFDEVKGIGFSCFQTSSDILRDGYCSICCQW